MEIFQNSARILLVRQMSSLMESEKNISSKAQPVLNSVTISNIPHKHTVTCIRRNIFKLPPKDRLMPLRLIKLSKR